MKCFHPRCNRGMTTGDALFRINAKGVPAVWSCREHMKNTDAAPVDPAVDRIVRAIEDTP